MANSALKERPSLAFTRNYSASAEKVWRAWTGPEAVKA